MAEKPNILIAIPAYGGSVKTALMESICDLSLEFQRQGVRFTRSTMNRGDHVMVRNTFASMMLAGSYSHLLMADSDMGFRPRGILKMLVADKPVIGWAAPLRTLPLRFNVKTNGSAEYDPKLGICSVDVVGTGVMLIRRDALETLSSSVEKITRHGYQGHGFDGPVLGFFNQIARDGERLGEDASFCLRWRETGGRVYALIDEPISHVGEYAYEGSLAAMVSSGPKQ